MSTPTQAPRTESPAASPAAGPPARPLWLSFWFAFVLLALIGAGIGAGVYVSARRAVTASVHESLESVARIKVDQMTRWLVEARRQADLALDSPMFTRDLERWIASGRPSGPQRVRLLEHLQATASAGRFRDVELRSAADGRLLLATDPVPADDASHRTAARRAVAERRMILQDFHATDDRRPGVALGFHTAIGGGATTPAVAAAHVELDPAVELLPFLNQWPGASATAETLLFRVDGSDIVYLNQSRHDGGTALRMRSVTRDPTLLAAQVARGASGALDGTDYRGVDVLGYAVPVAGTPWTLVAKMDRSEALAALDRTAMVASAALAVLLAAFAGWKTERSRRIHASYRLQFDRALLARRLEFLARHANEGIILADPEGRILEANERCAAIYGYRREEIVGQRLEFLWGETTPRPRFETVFEASQRRLDGMPIVVEISSRMVDIDGTNYLQALVRDVTARRRAEEDLRRSEERANRYARDIDDLYQNAPCGYHSIDAGGIIRRINDTELRWLGYERNEVVGRMHITDLLDAASRELFKEKFPVFLRDGRVDECELVFVRRNGSALPVIVSATAIYDQEGNFVASRSTMVDVSHLHMVRQERDRQAMRVEALSRHMVAVHEEERRRLACELQDRVAPNLAALTLTVDAVVHALPQPRAPELEDGVADAHAIVEDTVAAVREVCADLRPSLLDYAGLMPALVGYTQQYTRRTGIPVRLRLPPGDTRLGAETESTLFRIVQEALANVARHARASSVDLHLTSDATTTALTVRDDGRGFDAADDVTSSGLLAMRERAEFLGGTFLCISRPGAGTEIRVRLGTPQDTRDSPWRRLTPSDAPVTLQ